MANELGSGQAGGIGGVLEGFFGKSGYKPQYLDYSKRYLGPAAGVGKDVFNNIRGALPDFYSGFQRGTEQQRGFQGEQEQVLRNLLGRRLASDPQQLLQQTGNTLFGFIDPNVINPLSRFDVNSDILSRRARGLNPAAVESTAERLRNSRIASGRYYDVARQVYGALPNLFNQLRQAGITDEQIAAGYIPQIQQGYRALDLAPLIPLQAGVDLTRDVASASRGLSDAEKAAVYGYRANENWANRAGQAGRSLWSTVKDAAEIYGSLYGGGMGGMIGGGGAGGGAAAGAAAGANAGFAGGGYPPIQQPPPFAGYGNYPVSPYY